VDLDPTAYKVIAERAQELNERIRGLREKRAEAEQRVVPVKAPKLDKAQVEVFLGALRKKLSADPIKFGELVHLLKEHHDLTITVLDAFRVRVSLRLDHGDVGGQKKKQVRATAEVTPSIPLVLTGEAGARPLTAAEWAEEENKKGHYCACGCGERIVVKPVHHRPSVGIPRFIQEHSGPVSMAEFLGMMNSKGYLTVAQAAAELGVSENTLRRAQEKGWVSPERKRWGDHPPMRVYKKDSIPAVREKMKAAGFRFPSEESFLSTKEMAKLVGVSESTLRYWVKHEAIPTPKRDSAGRFLWEPSGIGSTAKFREKAEKTLREKALKANEAKVTTRTVAEALGVWPQTIRKWIYAGIIPEQQRDRAGRRIWVASDIERLKKLSRRQRTE